MSSHAEPDSDSLQLSTYQDYDKQFSYSRNAGAYKIADTIRKLGHTIEVLDFVIFWPEEQLKKFFDEHARHLDVVGWSSQFFFNFKFYNKWCDYLRSLNPDIVFITGGPKVTNLLNFKQSKYLIAGYAEEAIGDVFDHIEKKNNKLKFKLVNDSYYVDCLEFYKMIDLPPLQTEYHPSDYIMPQETLTLATSRGCIFNCSFCTYPYIGKAKNTFVRQGAQTYYDELMRNYEQWGITNYYLSDETVNDSVDKLKDLEEAALKLPFKLDLTGFARLDLMATQKSNWQVFKNTGFTNWHFGIETFNQQSLKAMSKGYSPDKLKQTLFELRDYFKEDATIYLSFIVGAPFDTPELFERETVEWTKNEGRGIIDGKVFFPLDIHRETVYAVGSEFSRNYQNYGYKEMTSAEIEYEISQNSELTIDMIRETEKYNILWSNPHWNALSALRYAKQYSQGDGWQNNISVWTRCTAISAGVPKDQIKSLCWPTNARFYETFYEQIDARFANYVKNKQSKNWFLD
jgi:radical SAM superfamily enzyme YgiQ (UPF0313 family)